MYSKSICPPVPLLSAFPDVNLDPLKQSKGKMCFPFPHICLSKNVPEAISIFSDLEVDRLGLSKEESGARGRVDDAYLDGALLGTEGDDFPEHCVRHSYGNVGIFRIWRKGASRQKDFTVKGGLEREKQKVSMPSWEANINFSAFGGPAEMLRSEVAPCEHWMSMRTKSSRPPSLCAEGFGESWGL